MSHKICTRHVGDQILKFLSPTGKITRICKWASGYLQPCSTLIAFVLTGYNAAFFYHYLHFFILWRGSLICKYSTANADPVLDRAPPAVC